MFRAAEHGQKDWIPLTKLLNRLPRPRVVKNDRRFIAAWLAANNKSDSHFDSPLLFLADVGAGRLAQY